MVFSLGDRFDSYQCCCNPYHVWCCGPDTVPSVPRRMDRLVSGGDGRESHPRPRHGILVDSSPLGPCLFCELKPPYGVTPTNSLSTTYRLWRSYQAKMRASTEAFFLRSCTDPYCGSFVVKTPRSSTCSQQVCLPIGPYCGFSVSTPCTTVWYA